VTGLDRAKIDDRRSDGESEGVGELRLQLGLNVARHRAWASKAEEEGVGREGKAARSSRATWATSREPVLGANMVLEEAITGPAGRCLA
jgi:hypothetical protein